MPFIILLVTQNAVLSLKRLSAFIFQRLSSSDALFLLPQKRNSQLHTSTKLEMELKSEELQLGTSSPGVLA